MVVGWKNGTMSVPLSHSVSHTQTQSVQPAQNATCLFHLKKGTTQERVAVRKARHTHKKVPTNPVQLSCPKLGSVWG